MGVRDVSRKLVGIDDKSLLVVASDDFMYYRSCIEIVASLTEDFEMTGVIVLLNKHVRNFIQELEREGISTENMWFVDGVSVIAGLKQEEVKHCITITHPSNYQELMVGINGALSNLDEKSKRFVMFISPQVMGSFMSFDSVALFFYQYSAFLKRQDILDLIMLERENNQMFEEMITNLADFTLEY